MQRTDSVQRTWADHGGAIAFCLSVLVYVNTFAHGATLDDVMIVVRNPLARGIGEIGRIFSTSYWGFESKFPDTGLYRPFTVTTFALESTLFGERLWPRHVVNVLLHATAAALVFATLRRWFGSKPLALSAAVVFALHPVHVEAVAGLVGRAEILAALGILGTLYAWSRGWFWIAAVACAIGVFSKEIGVTAPAVVLLAEWFAPEERRLFRGDRKAAIAFAVLLGVIALYLLVRARYTSPNLFPMGMVGLSAAERLPSATAALVEYARLFLFPLRLSADYTDAEVPYVKHLGDARFLAGAAIVVFVPAAAWLARRRMPALSFGLLAAAVTLAPVSNFFFGCGIIVAERALYSPSIGLCAALGAVFAWAEARPDVRKFAVIVAALLVSLLGVRTWTRNPVWKDNETLGRSMLETAPGTHIGHDILAQVLVERGDFAAAKPHALAALAQVDYADMRFLAGEIAAGEKRFEDAVRSYQRAIELDPRHTAAYNQLALLLIDLDRPEEARGVLLAMQRSCPREPTAWLNLVLLYAQYSNPSKALEVALEAVERFPDSSEVLRTAAAAHLALGHAAEASDFTRRAAAVREN